MNFFLTLNENGDVSFSPFLERDKLDLGVISVLNTPLPLAAIQVVQERLNRGKHFSFWHRSTRRETQTEILKILKVFGWNTLDFAWEEISRPTLIPQELLNKDRNGYQDNQVRKAFNQLVLGRQLSNGDLHGIARELKIDNEEITKFAHLNVQQGRAQWVPSVKAQGRSWQCQRCGEKDVEEWPSLYGMAATCRSCESIGASSSLDVLYRDHRSLLDGPSEVFFQPHWKLTSAQSLASDQVFEFIKHPTEEMALLWAACGAGKTEVCFPSAAWALQQGKSVLFAAPRQDVIHDVVPRFLRDFPDYPFQVLTGTTPVKYQIGGLVLATTHQVLRFWKAFDVIFMDEMDAFPYHGNRALEWGLHYALRQGGKILYLTATPSPEGLKKVQQGKMRLIRLPARHHRNPLPVPIWKRIRHALEPNECTGELAVQIEALRIQGPVMVFVPKISWIDSWIKCFQRRFQHWCVDGSYSADPGRLNKIEQLRQGEYDLFVSTTILERGITLSGIQVVVLAADHTVFDERALVQMAGRVGRTRENPQGKVIFMSKSMTPAMRTAIRWIEEQNKRALELGLIDTGEERS
ncbi:helicase-related protein [Desulfosporosinus sp. Sb-LF]|uniref:helicase-related protein n=1 Tax=Desulfosporosinus sp. Sb-LF TaxID=2560027 RepID=UPI00107F40BF|nr:helicase-related protein [Desulfosporosinus sp. Sb-LF]TGE33925.1 restriction endonuclease subunit R [Desulfosporosinus sp. Sb-LF]